MHELAFILQQPPNQAFVQRILMAIVPLLFLFYVIAVAIVMVPCWFILKKAGFTPWLALLCVVPSLGTLVLLYVLAFGNWNVTPLPQAHWQSQPPPVA